MFAIIIVFLVIYLIVKNNELTVENRMLKEQLNKKGSKGAKESKDILYIEKEEVTQDPEPVKIQIETVKVSPPKEQILAEKKVKPKVKVKKYNEQEIKNTTILSVGAILVILSAIIFLTTTWNTSLNIIKTLVIFLMFLVFLGSSYIADKYLNIKQTSKIFLYLAFSYLPLVFLSISLFELLGHYLSYFGPGKYVYLAMSTIIISIIYYYYMLRKKDIFFAVGSIIFQVFSVILLVLILTTNINAILFGISMYILILNYLYYNKKYYYNKNMHLTIIETIISSLAIITLFSPYVFKEYLSIDIYHILLLISLYFNICILLTKNNKTKEYINIASPIMMIYIFTNIGYLMNQDFIGYQLVLLIGIIINYLIELISSKDISIENYVINSIVLMVIYLLTFTQNNVIPSYYLLLLQILITMYKKELTGNNDLDYLISTAINIEILNIVYSLNINTIVLPIFYLIVFLVSSLLKDEKYKLAFHETSIIFTAIGFIIGIYNNNYEYLSLMIVSLITTLVYFIYYINTKSKIMKYISYGWLIITSFYTTMTINPNTENLLYSLIISSIITYLIDKYLSPKENNWYEFVLTELLITFICLAFSNSPVLIVLFPLMTTIFVLYNENWEKTDYLNIVPLISFLLNIINFNGEQYILCMIISLIITLFYFIYYINTKSKIMKYISYGWLIITSFYTTMTINPNTENLLYSLIISSIITYLIDKYLSPKENNWYEFILAELLITFICLAFSNSPLLIVLFPLMTTIFVLYNKNWEKTDYLNIVPIISFYTHIITNNYQNEMSLYTVISYLIPLCLLIYLYFSKKKEYMFLSFASIICAISLFPENLYLVIISLLLCVTTYYFVDNNYKKIYLSSIYILLTILAKKIIYDLNLTNITVLNIGIFTAPLILITRTIMSKENSDYKTIEYIGLIFIYSLAIPKYSGEPDGMLFVLLLLVLTIVSYNKKYGPVFLTSLCFILVNVFLLTRTFWLSIPWWIYILFVGSTLIAFSIRNEISEKNKKESLIKEVSKKLDL